MKEFRITTTVTALIAVDYLVEAESIEEALDQIKSGELRDEGYEYEAEINWISEEINSYAEIVDGEEVELQD
jgi:phosphoenolpyruvate carboxylase